MCGLVRCAVTLALQGFAGSFPPVKLYRDAHRGPSRGAVWVCTVLKVDEASRQAVLYRREFPEQCYALLNSQGTTRASRPDGLRVLDKELEKEES